MYTNVWFPLPSVTWVKYMHQYVTHETSQGKGDKWTKYLSLGPLFTEKEVNLKNDMSGLIVNG